MIAAILATLSLVANAEPQFAAPRASFPAITSIGGLVRIDGPAGAYYSLVMGDERHPLLPIEPADSLDAWRGRHRVPKATPPGVYALEWGEGTSAVRHERAVFVFEAPPSTYHVAHVTGLAFRNMDGESKGLLRTLLRRLAEVEDMGFAILSAAPGMGLTPEAADAIALEFATESLPIVVPAHSDQPYAQLFRVKHDAFLFLHQPVAGGFEDFTDFPAKLHRLRRDTKAARWSIGVTPKYEITMDVRTQLVLFADDPIHALLTMDPRTDEEEPLFVLPWKNTKTIAAPPFSAGYFRLTKIGRTGIDNDLPPQRLRSPPPGEAPAREP